MRPIAFAGCFGWLHPGTTACGAVLCSAHGEEEALAHRAWLHFAEELAVQGVTTVRFDYRGTGDSVESDYHPDRVKAWRESVAAAVAFLKDEVGVKHVVLVGLRVGALLAGYVAAHIRDIAGLILIAPVVNGKDYARELSVLATRSHEHAEILTSQTKEIRPVWPARNSPAGSDVEVLGYTYTAETLRSLQGLDLLALQSSPEARVLILRHPGRLSGDRVAAHLRGHGADVEVWDFPEYVTLMRGPPAGKVPTATFEAMAAWLGAPLPAPKTEPRPPPVTALHPEGLIEEPSLFGDHGGLFGISCQSQRTNTELPSLVFPNTWWNHHIGSGRLSVTMSRHFAGMGYRCFRFDVGGIGDSRGDFGAQELPQLDDAVADVRAALDHMEAKGCRGFILVGMCWGANLAARTTILDSRVIGQVIINSQRSLEEPSNGKTHARPIGVYARLLLAPATWRRVLSGDINLSTIARGLSISAARRLRFKWSALRAGLFGSGASSRLEPGGRLERWTRKVDTLLIYSANDEDVPEIRSLSLDGLYRRYPHLRLNIVADADHIFSRRAARDRLITLIENNLPWLCRSTKVSTPTCTEEVSRAATEC